MMIVIVTKKTYHPIILLFALKNVEHEIFDLVKNIVSNAKESNEQVNIDNNNDSDWTENESVYN